MTYDLLTLGEPLYEFAHISGDSWRSGHGGDVSNVAIAAARQGARTGIVTQLGDDSFGTSFRNLWTAERVDHRHSRTDPGAPTGLYFIRQTEDGHVFDYLRAGSAAARMTAQTLPQDPLRQTKILHFSGISLAISDSANEAALTAAQIAREAGAKVSFDLNLRLKLWPLDKARTQIERALKLTDIALPGLDDAQQLTGLTDPEAIIALYHDLGPEIVALTMGAEGTLVSDSRTITHLLPLRVEAVDATGAGDCFDGAFLARLAANDTPREAAAYATTAAGISVTGYGAVGPIPVAKEVRARIPQAS